MGAHVFLVGEDNFEVCITRGVYGCVMPGTERNRAEVVAGILSIQPDDLVFFYVKNRGVYGLWKTIGEPYFDKTKLWADEKQLFPYRFSFAPVVGRLSVPISLSDILDLRDKGRVWTFDLNPVQQKNQYKITTDEARELLRLLLRNNPLKQSHDPIRNPYAPTGRVSVQVELPPGNRGRIRYEGWLNAWFMRSLATGRLRELFGDYREFLNLVPTTFNKVIDIFLTHVTTVEGIEVLHNFTCIELKTDRAGEQDLAQILRYEDWLARKLAGGDKQMIQSVLVARRFTDGVVEDVTKRRQIEEKTVRLITYRMTADNRSIQLEELMPIT